MPRLKLGQTGLYWESLGEGEPVVFLNGILMTVDSWRLQTRVMSRRYRCVMHDFRGQLLSPGPEAPWTLESHSADLLALLDHLGIGKCHIVGTSYGGEVGMIFAATHPDRVRSLSVITSVSEVGPETASAVGDWKRAALDAPETLYRTMLSTTFSPEFVNANPALVSLGEARMEACDEKFFQSFAGLVDAFIQLNITPQLKDIRCPTLVIAGEKDLLKPPLYSEIIADNIVNSELMVIPGAGHAVVLEQPEQINRALMEFIDRN